jgi:hypothetical protein
MKKSMKDNLGTVYLLPISYHVRIGNRFTVPVIHCNWSRNLTGFTNTKLKTDQISSAMPRRTR